MPAPSERTAADYLAALKALLPTGAVWPRDASAAPIRILQGVSVTAARLHARANALLSDAFPSTAFELLPEWEATLGLPDPCAGPNLTLQRRRGQVVARLAGRGGQSASYFVQRAAALGYAVTIKEYAPSRLGQMRVGHRMQSADWTNVWAIQAARVTVTPFRLSRSGMGERFQTFGNAVLECDLRAIRPAHTTLLFQYI